MPSRTVPTCAAFGWLLLVGAAGTADAQRKRVDFIVRPPMAQRRFLADYCTIADCLERVAHDEGLAIEESAGGSAWDGIRFQERAKELFAVVADEQKFPFLGDGQRSRFCYIGRAVESRALSELRRIKVDLDTGKLTGPAGVDLEGLRIVSVRLTFTLRSREGVEVCEVHVDREFPDQRVNVSLRTEREQGPDLCRDLLDSLESKLRLASRLKAARKARRADEQVSEPMPKKPGSDKGT
jgi:hypothetical protein